MMVIRSEGKKTYLYQFTALIIVASLLFQSSVAFARQEQSSLLQIDDLLDSMSPSEKVGQLFLVTFNGSDTSAVSLIFELINSYQIGGVVVHRDNENFIDHEQILADCWTLISELQQIEFNSSNLSESNDPIFGNQTSEYIPLFVGVSQEGDQSYYSEIIAGLSPIPSQLALGATWDPLLAEQIGEQVGSELSALGINLLFGPSLDVLSNPSPGQSDLGTRSFGGDPYWVGEFGQAYIEGVHNGSINKIAVVAKYFPGLGGSDRLPEEEVATVRKSLEQLKQIDLAPFFAVTGNAPTSKQSADALLNSHIRYQGLQGNIRSTTRPISLDPQAFELLMSLEPLMTWRDSGGVIISDNLGSQAIQQLYDPTGESFNLSRVALDAFLAGNDILLLGNYGKDNKPIPNHDIATTLDFFVNKYLEDNNFAEKVDTSVRRILQLKKSIYPTFNISSVLTSENSLSSIGSSDLVENVAHQSATLINPDINDLDTVILYPPSLPDRLVILTDTETYKLCEDCYEIPTLSNTSLEDAIIRLYGPLSAKQIGRANINSYSFKDLTTLLDFPSEAEDMVTEIDNADWIIVASLDLSPDRPNSDALSRLLSERQDLLRGKTIIVFAFGAPYYLDATNISKISAYFGLYTKITASLDVAARILFKEFTNFDGRLPVSVPGINYDLISATSPDPDQSFSIYAGQKLDPGSPLVLDEGTPTPPVYRVEDIIDLHTGIIQDHNGNPVPDGTPVTFAITILGETTYLPQVTTLNGSASTSYLVQDANNISIHAESSLARSEILEIGILGDTEGPSTETTPTTPLQPTQALPNATEISSIPDNGSAPDIDEPENSWRIWGYAMLVMSVVIVGVYRVGAIAGRVRHGIIWAVYSSIGGLIAYNYSILGLPGASQIFPNGLSSLSISLAVLIGSLAGWLFAFLGQQIRKIL